MPTIHTFAHRDLTITLVVTSRQLTGRHDVHITALADAPDLASQLVHAAASGTVDQLLADLVDGDAVHHVALLAYDTDSDQFAATSSGLHATHLVAARGDLDVQQLVATINTTLAQTRVCMSVSDGSHIAQHVDQPDDAPTGPGAARDAAVRHVDELYDTTVALDDLLPFDVDVIDTLVDALGQYADDDWVPCGPDVILPGARVRPADLDALADACDAFAGMAASDGWGVFLDMSATGWERAANHLRTNRPATPTGAPRLDGHRRSIAIDTVMALCDVGRRRAANIVDNDDPTGTPLTRGQLDRLLTDISNGWMSAHSVALCLPLVSQFIGEVTDDPDDPAHATLDVIDINGYVSVHDGTVIAICDHGDWAWVTAGLPPKRTRTGLPSHGLPDPIRLARKLVDAVLGA